MVCESGQLEAKAVVLPGKAVDKRPDRLCPNRRKILMLGKISSDGEPWTLPAMRGRGKSRNASKPDDCAVDHY